MRMFWILLTLSTLRVSAQDVAAAVERTRRDVEESVAELNALRDRVAEERLPMTRGLEELRAESEQLRAEVRRLREARSRNQTQRADLEREVDGLRQELDFVETVFTEYRRGMEARAGAAEIQFLEERLPDDLRPETLADDVEELLETADRWHRLRSGGYGFGGRALGGEGDVLKGRFAVLGPVAYFLSGDLSGGIVRSEPGSLLPGVYVFDEPADADALADVIGGGEGRVPVDVSGGDALAVEEEKPTLAELLKQGGVVVVPLLLIALLSLILAVAKVVDLARLRVRPDAETLERMGDLDDGNAEAVLSDTKRMAEPLGSLLRAAVHHRHASREHLEEILHEHVLGVVPRLERSLGALAVFGGIAPLLGLLGTVTGMIHTFQLVKVFGSGNVKVLSGGISEALVTTAVGLVIAIPVLLVHAFLARRARGLLGTLEQTAVALVNQINRDSGA